MKTNLQDPIINDPTLDNKLKSQRIIPIFSEMPLNSLLSPPKHITSKKLIYPFKNKSFHDQQLKAKKQVEKFSKKQKITLTTQRSHINDLLFPLQALDFEKELIVFPLLQTKKTVEVRYNNENTQDKSNNFQVKINDIRKNYNSNILGPLNLQKQEQSRKNWDSWKKNQQAQKLRKSVIMPKISKKITYSPFSLQKDQRIQETNQQISCYSPSVLNRNRSQFKVQSAMQLSQKKKYRKGYLSYEAGGLQFWNKLKDNIHSAPRIFIDKKNVSAKIFFGIDLTTFQPIIMQKAQQQIQIASLSKIMTCYLSIMIAKKYEVDLQNYIYRVPDWITQTPGTSAQLQAGDVLSAYDLLYALMLPSGNDASICLAELMGKVIQRHKKSDQSKSYTQTFLCHMNFFSKQLGLNQSWRNCSGLSYNPNFSTAKAIVALAALALKDKTFSKVISTQQYQMSIKNDRYGLSRKKSWKNTNKLLQKGWDGVKTGTTESAGHCLMAKKDNLLLGVFDCQTLSKRFSDAVKLNDYIKSQFY